MAVSTNDVHNVSCTTICLPQLAITFIHIFYLATREMGWERGYFGTPTHSHNCERVQMREFEHFKVNSHIGSWESKAHLDFGLSFTKFEDQTLFKLNSLYTTREVLKTR
jgi:hypothetical protein